MDSGSGEALLSSFKRKERIIIVEDDRIRSVVIGPRQRLKPAIYVLAGLAALTFAAAGWLVTAISLHSSKARLAVAQQAIATLERQAGERQAALSGAADALAEARTALESAGAAQAALRSQDAERTEPAGKGAHPRLAVAAVAPAAAPAADVIGGALKAAARAVATMEALQQRAAADPGMQLPAAAVPGAWPDSLGRALLAVRADAEDQRARAAQLRLDNARLEARAAEAEGRIRQVTDSQVTLLARLSDHADTRIGEIEDALKRTGIDLEAVLRQLEDRRFGQGGPLVQLPEAPAEMTPAASKAMQRLEERLARQARLRALYTLLPLSAPVDDFYVSSGFGRRRDPITNQWALHTGIDLAADLRTPVTVTAPGTVVSVGYDDGYGRNVEVDHGFGIHTRYAHLDKTMVKQGDHVAHGQPIGLLGSTGRSVGPHVHYEVMIGGKPVDPLSFMEKGRHVCEG
jgi:murein DD-endopeptidase MepM/ murein hydrolase activator NlpD